MSQSVRRSSRIRSIKNYTAMELAPVSAPRQSKRRLSQLKPAQPSLKKRKIAASTPSKAQSAPSARSLMTTFQFSTTRLPEFASVSNGGLTQNASSVFHFSTTSPSIVTPATPSLPKDARIPRTTINSRVRSKRISPTKSTLEGDGEEKNPSQSFTKPRPLPWGDPLVWAETRPELCETLPYFNSWQSSTSAFNGTVRGKLLDNDEGERSYMDEEIVITRCGGGIGENDAGERVQVRDQNPDHKTISCFANNIALKMPLQLIVGSKNAHCPSVIPHRYCVMGPFYVTDVWSEKSNGHIVVKTRMEKVDLAHKSWWAAEDSNFDPTTRQITDVKTLRLECSECGATSPQVYEQGWICLNEKCGMHWTLNGEPIDGRMLLTYDKAFKDERMVRDGFETPFMESPKPLQAKARQGKTASVTKQCWTGMVCPYCGRCNQRRHWDAWRCRTYGCGFVNTLPREVVPATSLMGDLSHGYQGHAISDDEVLSPSIVNKREKLGLWVVHTYEIAPGCLAVHYHSNDFINGRAGGADDVFCALQLKDMGLERRELSSAMVAGTISAHFSKNFGLPYKYIVGHAASTSFQDAPEEIREAVRRMTWVGKRVVGNDQFMDFNELLAVGYFEGGKMGFHDDGEDTLAATVCSWSLGCPAVMQWRLKRKYFSGFTDKASRNYDPGMPVLPGCFKPEERHRLNKMAETMSQEELNEQAKKLLKGRPTAPKVVLKMRLRHGDFMAMHGAEMQKYFEHEVVPSNELRFGLTCRHVKPAMIPEDQHHLGNLNMYPANAYDGDMQLYAEFKKGKEAELVKGSMRRKSDPITAPGTPKEAALLSKLLR